MLTLILQLIMILVIPFLILKYQKFVITKWFGTVGTAYVGGIVATILIYYLNQLGVPIVLNKNLGEITSHISITLAIPLLLFSANLKAATKLSKQVLMSFASLIISATVMAFVVNYAFAHNMSNGSILSAMSVGMYTGGTPNFNAIGKMFFLDNSIIALANLSDMMIGALFYVFLLTLAKPFFTLFLKPSNDGYQKDPVEELMDTDNFSTTSFRWSKDLFKAIGISFLGVLGSAIIGLLIWIVLGMEDGRMNDFLVPTMLIGVTLYGIIIALKSKMHSVKHTNITGQYAILVFSFALASSMDLTQIGSNLIPTLIILSIMTLGTTIIHLIVSVIIKTDVDCAIVTLTAGIYGPAFIPAITKQIKNEDLTVPGLITGSIGYAIGTFLGYILGVIFLL